MLLIHHDHPQTVKLYLIVKQGMRADDECGLALRNLFKPLSTGSSLEGAGDERDVELQGR